MAVTCKAEESLTCSCVDVGTIIDGSDCSVDIHQTLSLIHIYSVISPEGCASILWKSAEKASTAAEVMGLTAARLKELGLSLIHISHRHPASQHNLLQ